jgi:50S ribosomal protein L16 3-hydroxylase
MQERLLGGLTARDFLRRHWQRKPLLARGALPHSGAWLTRRELFGLARLPQRGWTLLVSGVNLHDERAEKLLRLFDFLPRARLDDVMVSYAVPGGGVGPHRDSYDVFLVQGPGRRLWRLERARRFARVEGAPLDLIADFRPDTELLVETGDLLYLPPGWGHDGRALGP